MTTYQTFEEFLQEVHAEVEPTVLDDDGPDAFDAWLGQLDGSEYMEYAEEWGTNMYKRGERSGIEKMREPIYKYLVPRIEFDGMTFDALKETLNK